MKRKIAAAALGVAFGVVLWAVFLAIADQTGLVDRFFVYFPVRQLVGVPADVGLVYEDVSFFTSDGLQLHGWFVPGTRHVTWLWLHGNAGNVSYHLGLLKRLHAELGAHLFLFDYRGFGRSQGQPSEGGTYLDAEAALAYLRSRPNVQREKIVYFGQSLGAGVAVELAARHPAYGLILEGAFPSTAYVAERQYPFLPLWSVVRPRYDSLAKIGGVRTALLMLHGDADRVVPLEGARLLFDAAQEPKEWVPIAGAGHNDTDLVGGPIYFAALRIFLSELDRALDERAKNR